VEVYSGPIVIEKKEILYLIVHDITEKMEYYRKLEEARRRAEEASRVKDEFLANISHELRTPLNGIMGMFSILEDLDLGKEGEYWLSMARQSADNLYRIVIDLLDFTQIEAHKMSIQVGEFSIPELMTYILSLFQKEVEEKGLELRYTNTCTRRFFSGDRARIAQIVWNLVSNAVKYSRKGIIRIETGGKEGELSVAVEDEGMGIEADRIEDIFQPFRQLENPYTKTHSGVGLGLTFVKNLLELMKGAVTVDSVQGKGSRFEVRIPGQFPEKGEAEQPTPGSVRPETETGGTILVVEDEAINRLYLRSLLKKHSFSVVEAVNGRQAVEKTRRGKPDLVLMDIGLPVMDGLEAARQILQISEYADLPIIALTAHAYPAERERFMEGGMVDVITKPYQEGRLIQTLKRYL